LNSRHMTRILVLMLMAAAVLLAQPMKAHSADPPAITELELERSRPEMRLSFVVDNAFTPEIEEAVMGGISTTFTIYVELERVRTLWLNPSLFSRTIRHTVKYDTLRQEFEVTLDETAGKVVKTRDPAEMKRLMTSVEDLRVVPRYPLVKGADYKVRVMAELRTVRLPFLLEHVLIFVKFWDVETGWFVHRFTH